VNLRRAINCFLGLTTLYTLLGRQHWPDYEGGFTEIISISLFFEFCKGLRIEAPDFPKGHVMSCLHIRLISDGVRGGGIA